MYKLPLFNFMLMILDWIFAEICAFHWTKVKQCFGTVHDFGFKNTKINFLKKVSGLSAVFLSNLSTGDHRNLSSRLEENTIPWILFFDRFLWFKKKEAHFPIFWKKVSAAHTKISVCVLSYVNIIDLTQHSLISPFYNEIFSRLVSISGFNVKL